MLEEVQISEILYKDVSKVQIIEKNDHNAI